MTAKEKASFCALASMLLAFPEEETLLMLEREDVRSWLRVQSGQWCTDPDVPAALFAGTDRKDRLTELSGAYDRLFGQWNGAALSLVESTYKPWSAERDCGMVFANSTGLLMGDSALHMNELYKTVHAEVPPEMKSMPDHIVFELEFLSMLYDAAMEEHARCFIAEHLDWISQLKAAIERSDPHPFYRSVVKLIDLFIREEQKTEKAEDHGPKKIH